LKRGGGLGVITGSVIAVVLVAVGGTLIYLETAQQNGSTSVTTSKAPASGQSGNNIGGEISGAFSALHDAIVKTDTVTSTTTEEITSEKTTTTTVVSSTTRFSTLTQTSVATLTSTQFSTVTQTSVATLTSTTSVQGVPTNVTLRFTNISGNYTYDIQAGSSSTSGAMTGNSPYSVQLTGLFQGQTITITAATAGAGGCLNGQHFTIQLWVNGQLVANADSFCGYGTTGARITYTL
jgi:hypothetical protein